MSDANRRQFVTGLVGWWKRLLWRRKARRMSEEEMGELYKRLVIINRQLSGLPSISTVFKRRMELLHDRERCQTMITEWEATHPS